MNQQGSTDFRYIAHKMPYLPADGRNGKLIVIEGTDGSGRSTQAFMLKQWLEVQGYAVMETGWTRSKLIGQAITDAKQGHSLHRLTYCLMYATDLADRLEYQILPALRSGFIVLADRYIYTAIARGCRCGAGEGAALRRCAGGDRLVGRPAVARPHQPQIVEPAIHHRPRRSADVLTELRLHQDDRGPTRHACSATVGPGHG